MNNALLCALIAIAAAPSVFGVSLEELTGTEQAAALRLATEPITVVQQKNPSPQLLPRHERLGRLVAAMQSSLEPNMLVESLFLYHKPSVEPWNLTSQTGLLNRLAALSTLAGIQYYSASRGAMRIFYETSQVIDNPAQKNPLPDPVYDTLPTSFTLYARQKDLTFGDNIYRYDYHAGTDALFLIQENMTTMTAGIIPAIGKHKFRTMIAVIDADDSLVIYTAAMAKTASLPGLGDRIGRSFTNRIKAILQWFTVQIDGVFL